MDQLSLNLIDDDVNDFDDKDFVASFSRSRRYDISSGSGVLGIRYTGEL